MELACMKLDLCSIFEGNGCRDAVDSCKTFDASDADLSRGSKGAPGCQPVTRRGGVGSRRA